MQILIQLFVTAPFVVEKLFACLCLLCFGQVLILTTRFLQYAQKRVILCLQLRDTENCAGSDYMLFGIRKF